MTRIAPSNELLALIRQQAAALHRHAPGAAEAKPAAREMRASPQKTAGGKPDLAAARIAQAIALIRPDDPLRRRKAFRAFLEASLAREFGIADPTAPAFQHLLNTVEAGMLADPEISTAIDRAGDLLLRSAAV